MRSAPVLVSALLIACAPPADRATDEGSTESAASHPRCGSQPFSACVDEALASLGDPSGDRAFAVEVLAEGCAQRRADACVALGGMRKMGRGTTADAASAFDAYVAGCELGAAAGCHNAGVLARGGQVPSEDSSALARVYFERACAGGYAYGCWAQGELLRLGEGGSADPERAFELFEDACSADVIEACARAGQMRLDGYGTAPDASEAVRLLERACAESDPTSCAARGRARARRASMRTSSARRVGGASLAPEG